MDLFLDRGQNFFGHDCLYPKGEISEYCTPTTESHVTACPLPRVPPHPYVNRPPLVARDLPAIFDRLGLCHAL